MRSAEAAAQRGGRRYRDRAGPRGQHGPLRLLVAGRGGTDPPPGGSGPGPGRRPSIPIQERHGRRRAGSGSGTRRGRGPDGFAAASSPGTVGLGAPRREAAAEREGRGPERRGKAPAGVKWRRRPAAPSAARGRRTLRAALTKWRTRSRGEAGPGGRRWNAAPCSPESATLGRAAGGTRSAVPRSGLWRRERAAPVAGESQR